MKTEVLGKKGKSTGTSTKPKKGRTKSGSGRRAPARAFWIVAGIYNDGDGAMELVSNALWYDTLEEAKKRAFEWAHDLYDKWKCENFMRTNMQEVQFGDVWEKVDNGDPEFMDWGFDPVEDWGVSSVRIRVFKAYRGAA